MSALGGLCSTGLSSRSHRLLLLRHCGTTPRVVMVVPTTTTRKHDGVNVDCVVIVVVKLLKFRLEIVLNKDVSIFTCGKAVGLGKPHAVLFFYFLNSILLVIHSVLLDTSARLNRPSMGTRLTMIF